MRIIIVSQHFYPDTFRINDIAFALSAMGHTVRVVTGLPDYDTGTLPAAYRLLRKRRERVRGVHILRLPTTRRRAGPVWRFINYGSFALWGWLYGVFARRWGADVVLTYETSPVSQAIPAIRLARRNHCPHLLYCLDLWPECVKVWGVKEGGRLFRWVNAVSRRIYRAADLVPVSSLPFAEYLARCHGLSPSRTPYLPQPCESLFETVACQYEENGVIDFLFAGNVGSAQDIQSILRAVAINRGLPGYHVHIVGGGSELDAMRALAGELGVEQLVTFYGRRPLEDMPAFYRMADAFLLTLGGGDFVGQTLPGKLQSYLSAGKPVVAAAGGAVATVIAQAGCGICVPASDARGLAAAMARVAVEPAQFRALGSAGYQYYLKNFRMDVFLQRLAALVEQARGMEEKHHV